MAFFFHDQYSPAWGLLLWALWLSFLVFDPLKLGSMSGVEFQPQAVNLPFFDYLNISDNVQYLYYSHVSFAEPRVTGHESIAFDPRGHGPYTVTADGRVVRWQRRDESAPTDRREPLGRGQWETVAVLAPEWSPELCLSSLNPWAVEPQCGRPLSLRFHPSTGEIVVADAYHGLYLIPRAPGACSGHHQGTIGKKKDGGRSLADEPVERGKATYDSCPAGESALPEDEETQGIKGVTEPEQEDSSSGDEATSKATACGQVCARQEDPGSVVSFGDPRVVAASLEGEPLVFLNDLDVDPANGSSGIVYFTQSHRRIQRRHFMAALLDGRPQGRLLRHDLGTGETSVLLHSLVYPNGVTLSGDTSFLVFCEMTLMRCSKYHLKGPKEGQHEVWVDLPGFPDNIRLSPRGTFWVALHARRAPLTDLWLRIPILRGLMLYLSPDMKTRYGLALGHKNGFVVEIDGKGVMRRVLEDKGGYTVREVSEALEYGGKLWMGTMSTHGIPVMNVN